MPKDASWEWITDLWDRCNGGEVRSHSHFRCIFHRNLFLFSICWRPDDVTLQYFVHYLSLNCRNWHWEALALSRFVYCIVISLQFGRFGWRSNRQRTTVLIGLLSCMTKSFSFIVFFNFRILICQHSLALRICNVSSVWLDIVNDKKDYIHPSHLYSIGID